MVELIYCSSAALPAAHRGEDSISNSQGELLHFNAYFAEKFTFFLKKIFSHFFVLKNKFLLNDLQNSYFDKMLRIICIIMIFIVDIGNPLLKNCYLSNTT